jgi:hypothetical protein
MPAEPRIDSEVSIPTKRQHHEIDIDQVDGGQREVKSNWVSSFASNLFPMDVEFSAQVKTPVKPESKAQNRLKTPDKTSAAQESES